MATVTSLLPAPTPSLSGHAPLPAPSCHFPYTGALCDEVYADVIGTPYYAFSYALLVVGSFLVLFASYSLWRVIQWRGWKKPCKQRTILAHAFVSSVLFLVRSVDAYGWRGLVPSAAKESLFGISFGVQYLLVFAIVHGMSLVVLRQRGSERAIVFMNALYWCSLAIVPPLFLFFSIKLDEGEAWKWGAVRMGVTIFFTAVWSSINIASALLLYRTIRASSLAISTAVIGGRAVSDSQDAPAVSDTIESASFVNPLRRLSLLSSRSSFTASQASLVGAPRRASVQSGMVCSGARGSDQILHASGRGHSARHAHMMRKVLLFLTVTSAMEFCVLAMQLYVLILFWLTPHYDEYPPPTSTRLGWNAAFDAVEVFLLSATLFFFRPLSPSEIRRARNFAGKLIGAVEGKGRLEGGDSFSSVNGDARTSISARRSEDDISPLQSASSRDDLLANDANKPTEEPESPQVARAPSAGIGGHSTRLLSFIEEADEDDATPSARAPDVEMAMSLDANADGRSSGRKSRRMSAEAGGMSASRRSSLGDAFSRIAGAVAGSARRPSQETVHMLTAEEAQEYE